MTRLLLDQGLPVDGIVCYNDQIAVSVVHVLREMGKNVPEDISITGYDNSVMAGGDVSLTTIVHPQEKLGEMAAEAAAGKNSGGFGREKPDPQADPAGADRKKFGKRQKEKGGKLKC